jgi:hypothetical protein
MISMTVKISGEQKVAATLGRLAGSAINLRRQGLDAIGGLLVAKAKDNIQARTGPDGAWPVGTFSERSFNIRVWADIATSLQSTVGADGRSVTVGATHVAAAVRQLGTKGAGGELPDIVPVKKKALTIPISDAAAQASYRGIDARTAFPGSFILKKPKGASAQTTGIICRKVGGRTDKKTGEKKNQRLEMLYLLVSKAAIRPHRFLPIDRQGNLSPASLWDEIDQMLLDALVETPAGGNT